MNRTPVDSSMIASIGYDPKTKTLEIEFASKKNPAVWQYKGVPSGEHSALMSAHSKGKYFLANIKGVYAEEKQ